MTIDQRLDLERDDRDHESPQARLAGRGKYNFCHWCGRPDGMKSVHRETLAELSAVTIALMAPQYSEPGNDEYLFHTCPECNRGEIVPEGYRCVPLAEITYADDNPMSPDYEALAREEPVSQITDARKSAGLEG